MEDRNMELSTKLNPIAFGLIGVMFLASCSQEDRSKTAASGQANTTLEQTIQTSFAADSQLQNSELSVTANTNKSEVILSGTVPSEESRSRAVELAKAARPGLYVMDTIKVRPAEIPRSDYTEIMAQRAREQALKLGDKVGHSLDDAWLYTKVMTRLTANSGAPALKINVDVSDRVVTLRGQVDSAAAKEETERIAKETEGVKDVNSLLRVGRTAG
jgi:osmotically-inducible protein OsmY